ncbi:hypothetical protein FACS189425_01790 [Clostridia bacterium]|nr:hypothetical protein FACS189425_01790 [Clostridia bacterium]
MKKTNDLVENSAQQAQNKYLDAQKNGNWAGQAMHYVDLLYICQAHRELPSQYREFVRAIESDKRRLQMFITNTPNAMIAEPLLAKFNTQGELDALRQNAKNDEIRKIIWKYMKDPEYIAAVLDNHGNSADRVELIAKLTQGNIRFTSVLAKLEGFALRTFDAEMGKAVLSAIFNSDSIVEIASNAQSLDVATSALERLVEFGAYEQVSKVAIRSMRWHEIGIMALNIVCKRGTEEDVEKLAIDAHDDVAMLALEYIKTDSRRKNIAIKGNLEVAMEAAKQLQGETERGIAAISSKHKQVRLFFIEQGLPENVLKQLGKDKEYDVRIAASNRLGLTQATQSISTKISY